MQLKLLQSHQVGRTTGNFLTHNSRAEAYSFTEAISWVCKPTAASNSGLGEGGNRSEQMTSISTVNPAVGFLHCLAQGREALQQQLLSVLVSNLLMLKTTISPPAGLQDIVQEAMASAERGLGPTRPAQP